MTQENLELRIKMLEQTVIFLAECLENGTWQGVEKEVKKNISLFNE